MFIYWLGCARTNFLSFRCLVLRTCRSTCAKTLPCLIKHSFFAKMEHPDFRWPTVSSCCFHNRHLLSMSSFKILFLKYFVSISWSSAATIIISVSPLMYRNFSHRYDRSLSLSFCLSYVRIVHASFSTAIFILSSLLCPLFILFLYYYVPSLHNWGHVFRKPWSYHEVNNYFIIITTTINIRY
jgi:hypothetical protein